MDIAAGGPLRVEREDLDEALEGFSPAASWSVSQATFVPPSSALLLQCCGLPLLSIHTLKGFTSQAFVSVGPEQLHGQRMGGRGGAS